uniref:Mitochondrial carrier protein n=1 Tax=Panagrellus redivivus TaxID=6233 RepID=A0A7E4VYV8_PANRE
MSLVGYEHFVGGVSGGLVSTLVCHPMDLLKIRYSVNDNSKLRPQYSSYLDATRKIFRAEGIRGLYQGLSPNLLAAPIAWGLYFQCSGRRRRRRAAIADNDEPASPDSSNSLASLQRGAGRRRIALSLRCRCRRRCWAVVPPNALGRPVQWLRRAALLRLSPLIRRTLVERPGLWRVFGGKERGEKLKRGRAKKGVRASTERYPFSSPHRRGSEPLMLSFRTSDSCLTTI